MRGHTWSSFGSNLAKLGRNMAEHGQNCPSSQGNSSPFVGHLWGDASATSRLARATFLVASTVSALLGQLDSNCQALCASHGWRRHRTNWHWGPEDCAVAIEIPDWPGSTRDRRFGVWGRKATVWAAPAARRHPTAPWLRCCPSSPPSLGPLVDVAPIGDGPRLSAMAVGVKKTHRHIWGRRHDKPKTRRRLGNTSKSAFHAVLEHCASPPQPKSGLRFLGIACVCPSLHACAHRRGG